MSVALGGLLAQAGGRDVAVLLVVGGGGGAVGPGGVVRAFIALGACK